MSTYSWPSLIARHPWRVFRCNLRGGAKPKGHANFRHCTMGKPQARLTEGQKALVCNYHKKNPRIKFEDIGKWAQKEFKLQAAPDRSTVGWIIKNSTCYESVQPQNSHLLKAHAIPLDLKPLEEAMTNWILQMEHRKICLSDKLIQQQA